MKKKSARVENFSFYLFISPPLFLLEEAFDVGISSHKLRRSKETRTLQHVELFHCHHNNCQLRFNLIHRHRHYLSPSGRDSLIRFDGGD